MSSIIKVSSLSKRFRDIQAVDNLSFEVKTSDVYGFLGQNGAGKSTTIRILLTLVMPDEGDIEILGLNLRTHRKEILRQVGAVIERPDLYKYLTGYENLHLFARMNGLSPTRKQLSEQLALVGLEERGHSQVKTYSQGMQQRLGIAIALVHDPQIVILDEPVNGLDPQGIADMRNLILHLSRHLNKTLIVSSHLLGEMEQIATRMLIIDKGQKVMEGSVTELFDPARTQVEIGTTDMDAALAYIQGSRWNAKLQASAGSGLVLQLHRDDIPVLNRELVQAGVRILSIQPKNSLENYFLQITGGKQHVGTFTT